MVRSVLSQIRSLGFVLMATGLASVACASGPVFPALLGASGYEFDFGDFNGDQMIDVISVDDSGQFASIRYANTDGAFTDPIQVFVGSNVYDIVADDFNADGHVDFATIGYTSSSVAVYFNQGNGTFAAPKVIVLGLYLYPDEIEAADIDGDGLSEIFAAGYCLKNLGGGLFQQADFNVVPGSDEVSFADLNDDGLLDVLGVDRDQDRLQYALNLGGYAFGDPVLVNDPGLEGVGTAGASDIDADGDTDIVSVGDVVRIWRNEGGEFIDDAVIDRRLCSVALIEDFDGDQAADIIACTDWDGTHGSVAVLKNNGDGTEFEATEIWVGRIPYSLYLADTTHDGLKDLWVQHESGVIQYAGLEEGGFRDHMYFDAVDPDAAGMVDIDLDGDIDLVACSGYGITVSLNDGAGEYVLTHEYSYIGTDFKTLLLIDLNSDNYPDAVLAEGVFLDKLYVLLNDGTGGFLPRVEYDDQISEISDVVAGDIDGDQDIDLVVLSNDNDCRILRNLGDGSFAFPELLSRHTPGWSVSLGDLDGDLDLDLIITSLDPSNSSRFYNDGQGVFIRDNSCCGDIGMAVALDSSLGDMNNDGHLDLVTATSSGLVGVSLFDGAGGENQLFFDSKGGRLNHIKLADFDADSDLDVVVLDEHGVAYVLYNSGTGYLGRVESYFAGGATSSLELCDPNQDGLMDLIMSNDQRDRILILENHAKNHRTCLPDLNTDGDLNFFDVSAFLVAYLDGDPAVDFNDDGELNFFDVTAFIDAFNAGCP